MAKLKNLQMHMCGDVPDYVLEEMKSFALKLSQTMWPLLNEVNPNIAMGALAWLHASFLQYVISDEDLEKGAQMAAIALIKNVELLIKRKQSQEEK